MGHNTEECKERSPGEYRQPEVRPEESSLAAERPQGAGRFLQLRSSVVQLLAQIMCKSMLGSFLWKEDDVRRMAVHSAESRRNRNALLSTIVKCNKTVLIRLKLNNAAGNVTEKAQPKRRQNATRVDRD